MIKAISYITYGILVCFVLAFFLLAWRDLALLFRRPKGLGTGLGRMWAVARTAIFEAWAARVWVMTVLWLLIAWVLTRLVQPHGDDERERIGIYITILMRAQEYLLLVFITVLACFSLPRERERKTLVTTASKPISRLELFLGKVLGFVTLAALLLLVMGVVSYGFLLAADQVGKSRSWAKYERARVDYEKGVTGVGPPPEGLRLDAQQGVLQAGNFVISSEPMQVAGQILYQKPEGQQQEEIYRFVNGGSTERVALRFPSIWWAPGHPSPSFVFVYAVYPEPGKQFPERVELSVRLWAERNPSQTGIQEHRIALLPSSEAGIYQTRWQPEPEGVISMGPNDLGPVRMEFTCDTADIRLFVRNPHRPEESNVLADDTDEAHLGPAVGPMDLPKIYGFERDNLQQVQGPDWKSPRPRAFEGMPRDQLLAYCDPLEVAQFRFNKDEIGRTKIPRNRDGTFAVSMYLDVDKTENRDWPTTVAVAAYSQYSPDKMEIVTATVAEKRLTEVRLPGWLLSTGDDLMLDLRSLTPGHWLGANTDKVRLEQAESPFVWNLMKSEMVIFAEASLLVVIAVAASTRLGGPVALLLASVCFLLGNIFPFVRETALAGTNSILNAPDQRLLAGSWTYSIFSAIYGVFLKAVLLVINVLPDFSAFDPLGYLSQWRNMPLWDLGGALVSAVIFSLPFIAFAYLLSRKQELS